MASVNLNLVNDEVMHIAERSMHDFIGEGFSCEICSREEHSALHFTDKSSKRNQQGDFAEALQEALTHFYEWNS